MPSSEAVPRRATRRRATTRARLLASARELFAEQGVNGASVEELCARAEYTRGAFYSNFAGKDELVLAVFEDDRVSLLERLNSVLGDPPTDVTALVTAVMDCLDAGDSRQRYLARTEMTLHALRTPAIVEALVEARRQFRAQLRQALTDAALGTGHQLEVDPDLLVRTIEALHDGVAPQSLLEPELLPDGSLIRAMLPRIISACSLPARQTAGST